MEPSSDMLKCRWLARALSAMAVPPTEPSTEPAPTVSPTATVGTEARLE